MAKIMKCTVITISDRCSSGENIDSSGPYLQEALLKSFPGCEINYQLIPDEEKLIEKVLVYWSDEKSSYVIITTGGTGFAKRDVTPEATQKVLTKPAPGLTTALNIHSLSKTPFAALSRGICGIRNDTIIVNLPGSLKAVKECYEILGKILPHAVNHVTGNTLQIEKTHCQLQGGDVQKENKSDSNFENNENVLKTNENLHTCPHGKVHDVSRVAYRLRESPYPMIEVKTAMDLILKSINSLPKLDVKYEKLSLDMLGKVVGEDIVARHPFPPFRASTKDGYACISADGVGERQVRGAVCAGDSMKELLRSGECARINTGAPLPDGADCVVQVEDTKLLESSRDGSIECKIQVMIAPKPGQDYREIGSDIKVDDLILKAGTVLGPPEIGILASLQQNNFPIREITVSIMSTGNELQDPMKEDIDGSCIRDSNRIMLQALLRQSGVNFYDVGIVKDSIEELKAGFEDALSNANIVITTGGVSMGEKDLLKNLLVSEFNAMIVFGRVNMKPGKPMTLATCVYKGVNKVIFALPGNPVSALVTSQLFVIPSLRFCMNFENWRSQELKVRLDQNVSLDPRPEYVRAFLKKTESAEDIPTATLTGNQISSRLLSCVSAPLLLKLPSSLEGDKTLTKGTIVTALVVDKL